MAWTPTYAVINSRAIAENLLTYFEANQADAIVWAHGTALKPIARFENSIADPNNPAYPAIYFSDDNDGVEHGDDLLSAAYSVTFLVMVQNPVAATAVTQARSYAKAIGSMIANIPAATLAANTGATVGTVVLQTLETGFDVIKAGNEGKATNNWMQAFEIRAVFTLNGSAYL